MMVVVGRWFSDFVVLELLSFECVDESWIPVYDEVAFLDF
jgi:hypothetical protein